MHGVELAATAYAITHCLTNDNKTYLFHRFGDCYAHLNNSNDPKGFDEVALNDYIIAFENYINDKFSFVRANTEQLFMSDGRIITIRPNEIICDKRYITSIPRNRLVQMILRKILTADSEGGLESEYQEAFRLEYRFYLGSNNVYKKIHEYTYSDIVSDLEQYLPEAKQNSYVMYGADQEGRLDSWCAGNVGHTFDGLVNVEADINIPLTDWKFDIKLGGSPDAIVRRKRLFSLYIRHLYQLLTMINKTEGGKERDVCNKIDNIVEWASNKDLKDARFDGIFAFEIMCLNEKIDPQDAHGKQVLIPIKYLKEDVKNSDAVAKLYYPLLVDFTSDAKKQQDVLVEYLKDKYGLNIIKSTKSTDGKNIIVELE